MGRVDRWNRNQSPNCCPGFTLQTTTALAALLSLVERTNGQPITYNQLFRALGSRTCCSAHHRELLKTTLATLESIDIAIQSSNHLATRYEKLIVLEAGRTRPVFGKTAPAFRVIFSPTFIDIIANTKLAAPVHLPALCSIRSRTARCLYLILTTWAHYSRAHASHPFKISFSKLLSHLGQPISPFRSSRRAVFYGHRSRPIFDEINQLPTPYGILNLSITDSTTLDDDCLLVWISPKSEIPSGTVIRTMADIVPLDRSAHCEQPTAYTTPHYAGVCARDTVLNEYADTKIRSVSHSQAIDCTLSEGTIESIVSVNEKSLTDRPVASQSANIPSIRHLKIYQAWNASGRDDGEFLRRIRNTHIALSQNDIELLKTARITPSSCESFLLMAKKLLPERTWMDILGEAKYVAMSQTPPKSPTGKLIAEMLSALRGNL